MILAAGRGERLRPLTDRIPKPLIEVGGQPLIAYHLQALASAGVDEVVINIAYRSQQIRQTLGDGRRFGLTIAYSEETPGALDTGGGVAHALPLLGREPFILVSSDIWGDIDFTTLVGRPLAGDAHLVLVDNPAHHDTGDFGLAHGWVNDQSPRLTYAGVGVYSPALFRAPAERRFSLASVIRRAMASHRVTGQYHAGRWLDVGRPSALTAAREAALSS